VFQKPKKYFFIIDRSTTTFMVGSLLTVTSLDGTRIAGEKHGSGPALIIVLGALNDRTSSSLPRLVELLAGNFCVYTYDRRGKGDSGDTHPYSVDREIEDIEALIDAAGGSAYIFGHSSGAALALIAAAKPGTRIKRLAIYEVPYNDDPKAKTAWKDYIARLTMLLAQGKNGDAVALFMQVTGMPAGQIAGMRHAPFWPALEKAGPTLAYDNTAILGPEAAIPAELAAGVNIPVLVMSGGASFPFMRTTDGTLSKIIPHASLRILKNQMHDVSPEVLAPVLAEFFKEGLKESI
jgi:pimeloyl-ACP methyl ester carboxylesterase